MDLSSRGLGRGPFTAVTRVRISPGSPYYGSLAQLVEHLTLNQQVVGSNPTRSTILPDWYNGITAVSKTVNGGSTPSSGAMCIVYWRVDQR